MENTTPTTIEKWIEETAKKENWLDPFGNFAYKSICKELLTYLGLQGIDNPKEWVQGTKEIMINVNKLITENERQRGDLLRYIKDICPDLDLKIKQREKEINQLKKEITTKEMIFDTRYKYFKAKIEQLKAELKAAKCEGFEERFFKAIDQEKVNSCKPKESGAIRTGDYRIGLEKAKDLFENCKGE